MSWKSIKLDKERHVYTVGDRVVPGVTSILTNLGIIDTRWFDEQSRIRGDRVHTATQFHDEGGVCWDTMDSRIRPYVEGYLAFLQDTGFRPHLIEHIVYARDLDYGGTLDRTGWLPGRMREQYILLDIKSGSLQPWAALQTAAYQHALLTDPLQHTPLARYGLQLKSNGDYSFKPYPDPSDLQYWLSCVNVFNFKRKTSRKVYA